MLTFLFPKGSKIGSQGIQSGYPFRVLIFKVYSFEADFPEALQLRADHSHALISYVLWFAADHSYALVPHVLWLVVDHSHVLVFEALLPCTSAWSRSLKDFAAVGNLLLHMQFDNCMKALLIVCLTAAACSFLYLQAGCNPAIVEHLLETLWSPVLTAI